jgi:hypothetical protein
MTHPAIPLRAALHRRQAVLYCALENAVRAYAESSRKVKAAPNFVQHSMPRRP